MKNMLEKLSKLFCLFVSLALFAMLVANVPLVAQADQSGAANTSSTSSSTVDSLTSSSLSLDDFDVSVSITDKNGNQVTGPVDSSDYLWFNFSLKGKPGKDYYGRNLVVLPPEDMYFYGFLTSSVVKDKGQAVASLEYKPAYLNIVFATHSSLIGINFKSAVRFKQNAEKFTPGDTPGTTSVDVHYGDSNHTITVNKPVRSEEGDESAGSPDFTKGCDTRNPATITCVVRFVAPPSYYEDRFGYQNKVVVFDLPQKGLGGIELDRVSVSKDNNNVLHISHIWFNPADIGRDTPAAPATGNLDGDSNRSWKLEKIWYKTDLSGRPLIKTVYNDINYPERGTHQEPSEYVTQPADATQPPAGYDANDPVGFKLTLVNSPYKSVMVLYKLKRIEIKAGTPESNNRDFTNTAFYYHMQVPVSSQGDQPVTPSSDSHQPETSSGEHNSGDSGSNPGDSAGSGDSSGGDSQPTDHNNVNDKPSTSYTGNSENGENNTFSLPEATIEGTVVPLGHLSVNTVFKPAQGQEEPIGDKTVLGYIKEGGIYHPLRLWNKQNKLLNPDGSPLKFKSIPDGPLKGKVGVYISPDLRNSIDNPDSCTEDKSYCLISPNFSVESGEILFTSEDGDITASGTLPDGGELNLTLVYKQPQPSYTFTIAKTWLDGAVHHPASTYSLYQSTQSGQKGTKVAEYIYPGNYKAENSFEFPGKFPIRSEDGQAYYYQLEETAPDYHSTPAQLQVNGESGTFTLSNVPDYEVPVKVTQVWDNPHNIPLPDKSTVTLSGNNKSYNSDLTPLTSWKHSFEVPAFAGGGNKITYTLTPNEIPGWVSKVTGNQTDGFVVTSTPDLNNFPVTLQIDKVVKGQTEPSLPGAEFNLYRIGQPKMPTNAAFNISVDPWTVIETPVDLGLGLSPRYHILEATENAGSGCAGTLIASHLTTGPSGTYQSGPIKDFSEMYGLLKADNPQLDHDKGTLTVNGGVYYFPGDFCLQETKAPQGYELNSAPINFTVPALSDALVHVEKVANQSQAPKVTIKIDKKWYEYSWAAFLRGWGPAPKYTLTRVSTNSSSEVVKTGDMPKSSAEITLGEFEKLDPQGAPYTYTLSESAYKGYSAKISANDYDKTSALAQTLTFTVVNTQDANIPVKKVWQENRATPSHPDSVEFILKNSAGEEVARKQVSASDDWKTTFTVPGYGPGNKALEYSVEETPIAGWKAEVTGDSTSGFTVTNSATKPNIYSMPVALEINKVSQDGNLPLPGAVFDLYRVSYYTALGVSVSPWIVRHSSYDLGSVGPHFETMGVGGYAPLASHRVMGSEAPADCEGGHLIASGLTTGENGKYISGPQMTFADLQNSADAHWSRDYSDGILTIGEHTYFAPGDFCLVERTAPKGYKLNTGVQKFSLKPADTDEKLIQSVTVTNEKAPSKVAISLVKKWVDGLTSHPETTYTLKRSVNNGEAQTVATASPIKYPQDQTGPVNIGQFDLADSEGHPYTYVMEETPVPEGYKSSVSYSNYNKSAQEDQNLDVTFTNLSTEERQITVTKNWQLHPWSKALPAEITFKLKGNGQVVKTFNMSATDQWHKTITVPKFDENGLINYTLEEDKVEGWDATISGSADAGFIVDNKGADPGYAQMPVALEIDKTAFGTNKPLPGAVFDLYRVGTATSLEVNVLPWNVVEIPIGLGSVPGISRLMEVLGGPSDSAPAPADCAGGKLIASGLTTSDGGKYVSGPELTLEQWKALQPSEFAIDAENGTVAHGQSKYFMPGDFCLVETQAPASYKLDATSHKFSLAPVSSDSNRTQKVAIVNKFESQKLAISVTKTWIDEESTHPQTSYKLYRSTAGTTKTLVKDFQIPGEQAGQAYSVGEFDLADEAGNPYTYEVTETAVEGYTSTVSACDGYDASATTKQSCNIAVVNKSTKQLTIPIHKVWNEAVWVSSEHPEVTVNILGNGKQAGSVTLNKANSWSSSLSVPAFDDAGAITYTAQEVPVPGWTSAITPDSVSATSGSETGFTATNTAVPPSVDLSTLPVVLQVDTIGINSAAFPNATFWVCRLTPAPRPPYRPTALQPGAITLLSRDLGVTDAPDAAKESCSAVVIDNASTGTTGSYYSADNHQPTAEEMKQLVTNPQAQFDPNSGTMRVGNSVYLFPGDYYFKVTGVPTGYLLPTAKKFTVLAPAVESDLVQRVVQPIDPIMVKVELEKTWSDGAVDHPQTSYTVYRATTGENREEVAKFDLPAASNASDRYEVGTFPAYNPDDQQLWKYTVKETAVPAYTAQVGETTGPTQLPSEDPVVLHVANNRNGSNVPVKVVWDNSSNPTVNPPADVTVSLTGGEPGKDASTKIVPGEQNNWTGSFTDIPSKDAVSGNPFNYQVAAPGVNGWNAPVVTGNPTDGFIVTYTTPTANVNVPVTVVWDKSNDPDATEPADGVSVTLTSGGTPVDSVEPIKVDANDSWSGSFKQVPSLGSDHRTPVDYSATGPNVPGWGSPAVTKDSSGKIILTYTAPAPELTIPVKVVWNKNGNDDAVVPDSVTVHVIANGKPGQDQSVNTDGDWSHSFTGLPKLDKANGNTPIVYSAGGQTGVPGWGDPVLSGDAEHGFVLTYTASAPQPPVNPPVKPPVNPKPSVVVPPVVPPVTPPVVPVSPAPETKPAPAPISTPKLAPVPVVKRSLAKTGVDVTTGLLGGLLALLAGVAALALRRRRK